MPDLKKFCPESHKEHAKDLTFCKDYRDKRKALLQPIKLIDLTIPTPPSRTNSGRRSCPLKVQSQSAIDYMHKAN